MPTTRLAESTVPRSALGGAGVALGAVLMLAAVVAMPGPWTTGYVSEAGSTGEPLYLAYRAGLVLLAVGVALIGTELGPVARALLLVAAVMAGTSGVVPCSAGCPLPPFEPTTPANVVHTLASIVGMVLLALSMAAVAVLPGSDPVTRRLSAAAFVVMVPPGLWLAWIMLFVGRGQLGANLERFMLVVAVTWLVGVGVVAVLRPRSEQDRGE